MWSQRDGCSSHSYLPTEIVKETITSANVLYMQHMKMIHDEKVIQVFLTIEQFHYLLVLYSSEDEVFLSSIKWKDILTGITIIIPTISQQNWTTQYNSTQLNSTKQNKTKQSME